MLLDVHQLAELMGVMQLMDLVEAEVLVEGRGEVALLYSSFHPQGLMQRLARQALWPCGIQFSRMNCLVSCMEQCRCTSAEASFGCTYCPVGKYRSNSSTCVECPKNSYSDGTIQNAPVCMPCVKGFVTVGMGAPRSMACKSWCSTGLRMERGFVMTDTFPKVSHASNASVQLQLAKV